MADEGPSPAEQEAMLKKKYGGVIPKKKSLLNKGHERAYFDSAEWAINKQKGEVQPTKPEDGSDLQPKLEPTPAQPQLMRRSSLADWSGHPQ